MRPYLETRSYWSPSGVLIERGHLDTDTATQRGVHAKTEAEQEHLRAMQCQGRVASVTQGSKKREGAAPRALQGAWPCPLLDLTPSAGGP